MTTRASIGHKLCKKCSTSKPADAFLLKNGKPVSPCKECIKALHRAWQAKNKDRVKSRREERKEEAAMLNRAWASRNRERLNAYMRTWRKRATYARGPSVRRDSAKCTPAWANRFFLKEAYRLAQLRTLVTGVKWHVDHLVPINSPLVCGLHVENNLAVIPAAVNWQKGNRVWPDMWEY